MDSFEAKHRTSFGTNERSANSVSFDLRIEEKQSVRFRERVVWTFSKMMCRTGRIWGFLERDNENPWTAKRAWRATVRSILRGGQSEISKRHSSWFEWDPFLALLLARSLEWIRIGKHVRSARTTVSVVRPMKWIWWASSSHRPALHSLCSPSIDWWSDAKWIEQNTPTSNADRSLYRSRQRFIDSIHRVAQTKQRDEKAEWRHIHLSQAGQILACIARR